MYSFVKKYKVFFLLLVPVLFVTCSTKKNTNTTRTYHAINTKYNIYFNAEEAYKEALKAKQEAYVDTFSQILQIYPVYPAKTTDISQGIQGSFETPQRSQGIAGFVASQFEGGDQGSSSYSSSSAGFARSIEKNTKAIKLHSIKARPERNPSKRRDPKYQAWLQQQEYNPFLHNAWLLLGKSEYQDGDYIQAISTFSYIIRIYHSNPAIVAEARMWMAKSNISLGWYYEAEDIFNQIRLAGGVPDNLKAEFNQIYADFLLKREEYKEAIPFVADAIGSEKNRLQRTRLKYLLGQLYKREGDRTQAYQAFEDVHGLSTPYLYSFNARIEQASFVDETNKSQILSQLNKMTRDKKNENYLDQIYYAIGNIHLNDRDTVKAVENYRLSIEKSTRNGEDKAITEVVLGDIYFRQRDYIKAQPIYSDALNILSKRNENYPTVALRSSVLDELVVYVQAVHLQDSLQTLARMPENERIGVIYNLIADIKKKEEEERKRAEREELLANRELSSSGANPLFDPANPEIPTGPVTIGGDASNFYFYNPQAVAQGKAAFQRKWGTRKLEDDWRRRNKQAVISFLDEPLTADNDSVPSVETENQDESTGEFGALNDIYSVDFYLQQIPLTPEAIETSNEIIEDAYFNMGKIYKDKLGDYSLAIEAFETDLSRFPNTPNLEEIYYQLFLIYLRLGDSNRMEVYRVNLLNTFPEGTYAAALRDENYQWNMLNMYQIEDNLYQETYDLYLTGNVNAVRANYQSMKERYPLSTLMPKFAFLNSLTYAQTQDLDNFRNTLTDLIALYPQSEVTPLASDMLKGILSGKALSSDSSPFRGMIWDIKLGGDSISTTEGIDFIADAESDYMLLLIYRPGTLDKNQLIYEVANYNFSNFVYQTFDLAFSSVGQLEILQVRGFRNLEDIITYINRAFEENSLMSHIDPDIIPVPISEENYIALLNGKTLNQYFLFFEENYTSEMLTLIRYWNRQKEDAEQEADGSEIEPAIQPEEDTDTVHPVIPEVKPQPADTIPQVIPQFIPESDILPKAEPQRPDSIRAQDGFGFGDILSDDQLDKADDLINKAGDILSNPVDGLRDLFRSSGGDDSSLTKEEKEALKQAEKERKEQEKAREKAVRDAEKMRQDSIRNAEKEKIDAERALQKAKEDEIKAAEQAKKDAEKQAEKERKEREKAKREEQKQKEKARKEELKRKEQERKERLKQLERERKEKLKQREAELKERERQRRNR